jgi:pentose-5-phosphate-3-epimerase
LIFKIKPVSTTNFSNLWHCPAINTADPKEALDLLTKLGEIVLPNGYPPEKVQIDINDGTFENIKTITPEVLADVDSKLMIDFHLMVGNPTSWIERCVRNHAERVIGQIEKIPDQIEYVEKITQAGVGVGFALDIDTPIDHVDESLLTSIDVILLMTYPAGKGGKKLEEKVFEKIEKLVEIKSKASGQGLQPGGNATPFKICLDGGITLDNIKRVKLAGVDEVAITKRILEGDIEENLENFYRVMY